MVYELVVTFVIFSAGGGRAVRVGCTFSWRLVGCTSWLYFQLEVGGVYELVVLSARGWRGVRVGWLYFQLEVGGVYELVVLSAGGWRDVRVGSHDTDGFLPVQDRRRRTSCEVQRAVSGVRVHVQVSKLICYPQLRILDLRHRQPAHRVVAGDTNSLLLPIIPPPSHEIKNI